MMVLRMETRNTYTLQQRIAKRWDLCSWIGWNSKFKREGEKGEELERKKKKRREQKQLVCFEDNVAYTGYYSSEAERV